MANVRFPASFSAWMQTPPLEQHFRNCASTAPWSFWKRPFIVHTDLHEMIILRRFYCDSDYVYDDIGWWISSQYRECDDRTDWIMFCFIACWTCFPFSSASKWCEESAKRDILHFSIPRIVLRTALQTVNTTFKGNFTDNENSSSYFVSRAPERIKYRKKCEWCAQATSLYYVVYGRPLKQKSSFFLGPGAHLDSYACT